MKSIYIILHILEWFDWAPTKIFSLFDLVAMDMCIKSHSESLEKIKGIF